jgi:ATP-dependent protease ClpP protease subunit
MAINQLNLYGIIGEDVRSVDVKKALLAMDQTQPLVVKIDSEGGSVFDGFSIANALEAYGGPKKIIVEPQAFSIASYIVSVFDEVVIVENGYIMAHMPYTSIQGTSTELANKSVLLADLERKMVARYMDKTGFDETSVRELLNQETFLNAEESVRMGIATSILPGAKTTRSKPTARYQNVPTKVYAALFGSAGLSGDNREKTEEQPMSNATPVAATVQEIKSAFPKAKSDFIVRCLEKSMPLASVAAAAAEELMAENEELMAKVSAMEEELASFRAKAMEDETKAEETVVITESGDEEEEPVVTAKAKGAKPVARVATSGNIVSAKQRWDEAVATEFVRTGNRANAVLACAKNHRELHQQMLAEVNAR